jgi:hypothetical protein
MLAIYSIDIGYELTQLYASLFFTTASNLVIINIVTRWCFAWLCSWRGVL